MLKTKKSLAKRFRFTKKKKIKYAHAYKGHILSKKSNARKRRLRKSGFVSAVDYKKIRRMLPYG